eukprot:9925330-Lingulodinium_polyedra.AAC.1
MECGHHGPFQGIVAGMGSALGADYPFLQPQSLGVQPHCLLAGNALQCPGHVELLEPAEQYAEERPIETIVADRNSGVAE